MKARDAFNICHEIYAAARELVDSRLPTTRLESAGKFLWRPDLRPRMVEYVADFALAGERALAADCRPRRPIQRRASSAGIAQANRLRASRLVLFRLYFLGGAEYQAARHLLGLSELTWSDWTEEIRGRVGRELMRSGMFPPSRYFRPTSVKPATRNKSRNASPNRASKC
jgi:hypothetical protein